MSNCFCIFRLNANHGIASKLSRHYVSMCHATHAKSRLKVSIQNVSKLLSKNVSSQAAQSGSGYKRTRGLWLAISGVGLGIGTSVLIRQHLGLPPGYVHCAYRQSANVKSRLAGLKDELKEKEPEFPWKEFLKLLVPECLYLIGAVVVSTYI